MQGTLGETGILIRATCLYLVKEVVDLVYMGKVVPTLWCSKGEEALWEDGLQVVCLHLAQKLHLQNVCTCVRLSAPKNSDSMSNGLPDVMEILMMVQ